MTNGHEPPILSLPSLFPTPFSYPARHDLFQRSLNFSFILQNTTTLHANFLFSSFLYFSGRPPSPIKPAGALDGHDHHDSDQRYPEFTSEICAWTLIFVPDEESDAQDHSEDFTFTSTFDFTQFSKPGERTVFFCYGCHPRGWYGCTEPYQQQHEQREPEQHV